MRNVALVGVGRWGRALLRELRSRCRLAVCHAGSQETAGWLDAHHPSLRRYASFGDVLADPDVEAVVLATPIATHAELTGAALTAGKHVFVEKPLAMDAAQASALVEQARASERLLFVGYVFLHHPALAALEQRVASDPIRHLQLCWRKLGTFDSDLVWNLAVHEISLALRLTRSEPSELTLLHRHGVVTECDVLWARFGMRSGDACLLSIDRCAPDARKVAMAVTRSGRAWIWDDDRLLELGRGGELVAVPVEAATALGREIEAFLYALELRPAPAASAEHAALVTRWAAQLAVLR
jgi:predicted dehydrogenase